MPDYKTPGVYVEEISLLPPSVAQVETAIPAFIGYTETGPDEPTRITSMLEFTQLFGGPQDQAFEVTLSDDPPYLPQSVAVNNPSPYLMHYALQMFFANGGGPCYIVSVGNYDTDPKLDGITDYTEISEGLKKVRKVDEVTLLVMPEATNLEPTEQYDLYKDILAQCGELKDRFGIFDLRMEDDAEVNFRNGIGTRDLSYGAAYYPHLRTSLPYQYSESGITFSHTPTDAFDSLRYDYLKRMADVLAYQQQLGDAKAGIDDAKAKEDPALKAEKIRLLGVAVNHMNIAIQLVKDAVDLVEDETFSVSELTSAETTRDTAQTHFEELTNNPDAHTVPVIKTDFTQLANQAADLVTAMNDDIVDTVATETGIGSTHHTNISDHFTNAFTAAVDGLLSDMRLTLPPSSAIAGVYARVDEDRGVWKAPANVSLNRVTAPATKLSMDENDNLNVHPTGKSINAIRAFTGKGTLVWGARTLDGNSNEWKYVPVRRFFNMVEESVKKASEPFVFESNDANTWVKVKAMIENFLTVQWRAGALMGGKPEQAFFVKVGLGETMTQENVLNGEMIVEIGMAVVRPAEFIILRFSHKMLES